MSRLRRVDPSGPGLARRREGDGFVYLDPDGERVEDPEVLSRIGELVIPPAWEDVWICPYPHGHIQATGMDGAGRRQYVYHRVWRERRDGQKFDQMTEFARALPALRERVHADLAGSRIMGRERVLACAIRLLDVGFFRIGSEDYAARNETYGLATIRKRHVRLGDDGQIVFDYTAKHGKRRIQAVVDDDVREVVAALKRRRGGGPELLAYKVGRGWHDVRSGEINLYLKEVTGGDFSAKEFRTWNATVLAAVALAVAGEVAGSRTGRDKAISRAVKETAHYLGNTPAVCRASYIDPRVFDAYRGGITIGRVLTDVAGEQPRDGTLAIHRPEVEEAVLDLVGGRRRAPGLERVA